MPIPESQLETWSHQGAVVTSSATYRSIQTALAADSSSIRYRDYEVYLQGSYKNDTNIRADSDVDVVVQLNSTFGYDLSGLDAEQKRLFFGSYPANATYLFSEFRADALRSLVAYYGDGLLTEGTKSIKLSAASGRLAADIIPGIQHHRYRYFYGPTGESHVEGIQLWDRNGSLIVNFPKIHYDNGVTKNSLPRTNGWYKPAVRLFKNARSYAIDHALLPDATAPSYFVECLLIMCRMRRSARHFKIRLSAHGTGFQTMLAAAIFSVRTSSCCCSARRQSSGTSRTPNGCWRR